MWTSLLTGNISKIESRCLSTRTMLERMPNTFLTSTALGIQSWSDRIPRKNAMGITIKVPLATVTQVKDNGTVLLSRGTLRGGVVVQTWNIHQIYYPYKAWSPCSGIIRTMPLDRSQQISRVCLPLIQRNPDPCVCSVVLTLVLGEYAIHRLVWQTTIRSLWLRASPEPSSCFLLPKVVNVEVFHSFSLTMTGTMTRTPS